MRHGAAALLSGLCGPAGGVGVAIAQDLTSLRFRVTHLAPAGAAERSGVRVGDVILAVDGRCCADATGLTPAQADKMRQVLRARGAGSGGGSWWLGGSGSTGEDELVIGDPAALQAALAGPVGSAVRLRLARTAGGVGEQVLEMRLERGRLALYAGDYM